MSRFIFSLLFPALFTLAISVICADNAVCVDFAARNLETITKIYETVTYPNNLLILQNGSSATPPGLFNANVAGRVTPVGNFTGFADSTEYFFALTPVPGQTGVGILTPNYNTFTSINITSFTSQCPEVASSVVNLRTAVYHPGAPDHGNYISTLKEIAFWRFDNAGAVLYYDAWIPNLPLWYEKYSGVALDGTGLASVVVHEAVIATNFCPQIMDRCTGKNVQYGGLVELCIAELSLKPFGTFDEAWGDNVVCRLVHVVLAQIRPEVHCVHIGPTGGGKCVNIDYNIEYIADDTALFGGNHAFVCPT